MEYFERKPKLFLHVVKFTKKLGKVNGKVVELSEHFSNSRDTMVLASRTWRNFRSIKSQPEKIGALIMDYQTPFSLYMGEFDGIFPPKKGATFLQNAGLDKTHLRVLKCGHDFFKPETIQLYKNELPFMRQ